MATKNTKKLPSGYWTNYENNYQEAKKYKSRSEFSKGCQSAYQVARQNGWLDNYTWFISTNELQKINQTKWNEKTCYQEAKKYNSRNELQKGCSGAYRVALDNGWLDDYTWFKEKKKCNYWTNYENNYQEAQKYKSRKEFQKGCGSAYKVASEKGWLDDYTWFIPTNELMKLKLTKWNEKTCYQEAKKYKSRNEFKKGCESAYDAALKNCWMDDYTWFKEKKKCNYWTNYENNYNEARKYKSRREFQKGCQRAYQVARINGWLDNYTWFEKDLDPYKNKRDNVYCYIFTELHSIYIGRTIDINRRNEQHNNPNKDSIVYKFAKYNNIPIPQITILETKLSLEEGLEKEDFYVNKYKQEGWNVLNKAKTGKNCGALGTLNNRRWNEKTCYQEAQKYKSRTEFAKCCHGAYHVARKNGWLDNYTWFETIKQPCGYWTNYENNYNEAQKYKSRSEFARGCGSAYDVASKNGWLDNYTWFIPRNELQKIKQTKWTYETCYQEAQKYKSRKEFSRGCGSAYDVARINGWLDKYTWFEKKQQHSGYWTNYENNYQEAKKYNSRFEFQKGCSRAYEVARINGWLDKYFPK